jgi:hypothetical protein
MDQRSHPTRQIRPSANIIARAVGESMVLVHLQSNRIYELNTTGSRAWELIGSGASDSEIVRLLSAEFAVSAEVANCEFQALLGDLEREGLLEPAH